MNIGILGASDIAFRRFLPALKKCPDFTYMGVASRTPEKGRPFQEQFGGVVYDGYDALLADERIDVVYLPLPPALHFEWGQKVLNAGKHLLMEKPFATGPAEAEALLRLAEERGLAVHENYMFLFHSQLKKIKEIISSGELGRMRLFRMSFGFPMRAAGDFRYAKALGGGALLDCGGYPLRLAAELLGESARLTQARLCSPDGYEVDLYGSAVLENDAGLCAQVSFGMDNAYQCRFEAWGSKATLVAPRIFTAGAGFEPPLILQTPEGEKQMKLASDDQFLHSIEHFARLIREPELRKSESLGILRQIKMVEELRQMGERQ